VTARPFGASKEAAVCPLVCAEMPAYDRGVGTHSAAFSTIEWPKRNAQVNFAAPWAAKGKAAKLPDS